MTSEQQFLVLAFVANVVALLHEEGHSRACAEHSVQAAVACLFGIIWQIPPDNPDETDSDYVASVIHVALDKFYGKENAHVVC